MNVLVTLCQRFDRTPDGSVWTPGPFPASFWARYLEVFDGVRVLARLRDAEAPPPGWQRADDAQVQFVALPNYVGPWQYLRRAWQVKRAARQALRPTDAVIFRIPSNIASYLGDILHRAGHPYGVEVVQDPHDVFAPGAIKSLFRPFFRWYFVRDTRRQCGEACAAAYVSTHRLRQRYPCPGYSVGYSSVQLPPTAWVAEPRPMAADRRTFTLVTVGTLQQLYKAPDILIDAVANCVRQGLDLKLVLAGDGQYLASLQSRAAALGLAQRVEFLGHVAGADRMHAVLDAADLFVLPSRAEGLPRAMIEAMARALPCIGSDVGGIPELLSAEDLVAPNDVTGLANKIMEVLKDPARLARMSARNLTRAEDYREELVRERRLAFYQTIRDQTTAWLAARQPTALACQ